jgi:sulfite exporter TauE/SafE
VTVLLAGLLLGMAGGVHCLGMCGPLVLVARGPSVPSGGAAQFFAYHGSRIAVYLLLGALAGLTGDVLAGFGWRHWIAIAAGIALLMQASGMLARALGGRGLWILGAITARVGAAARLMPRTGVRRAATFGVLNGILPCGLLYAALAAAAGLGGLRDALTFVAAFGLGTLPVFAALVVSARVMLPRAPHWLRQAAPVALAIVGLLLIERGLPREFPHAHDLHARAVHALGHP